MIKTFSCKGCDMRHFRCHSHCEIYKKEKAEHEARKAAEDKKRATEVLLNDQKADAIRRAKRRRGQKI